MRPEFRIHTLDDDGQAMARDIAEGFDALLAMLETVCLPSREFSLCKTKLEEACMFATKSMAIANGTA